MRKELEAERGFPDFLTLSWAWQESLEDPASVKAALARNLRHHREVRGLSHKTLAQSAQVNLAAIRDIEAGRGLPDIATLSRLSQHLGISCAALADPLPPPATATIRPEAKAASTIGAHALPIA